MVESEFKSVLLAEEIKSTSKLLKQIILNKEGIEPCVFNLLVSLKKISHLNGVDFNKINDKTNL